MTFQQACRSAATQTIARVWGDRRPSDVWVRGRSRLSPHCRDSAKQRDAVRRGRPSRAASATRPAFVRITAVWGTATDTWLRRIGSSLLRSAELHERQPAGSQHGEAHRVRRGRELGHRPDADRPMRPGSSRRFQATNGVQVLAHRRRVSSTRRSLPASRTTRRSSIPNAGPHHRWPARMRGASSWHESVWAARGASADGRTNDVWLVGQYGRSAPLRRGRAWQVVRVARTATSPLVSH